MAATCASTAKVLVSYTDLELKQKTVSTPNIPEDLPAVPDLGRPAEEGLAPPEDPVNQLTVADNIKVSYENSGQVNTTGTWARSVSIGFPVPYSLEYQINNVNFLIPLSYSPRTVSTSGFSEKGLLKGTLTESKKPYGAAGGSYVTELLSAGAELPPGDVSTFTQETYSYNRNGQVIRRGIIEYISLPEFAGSLPIDFEKDDGFVIVSGAGYAKKASSVTTYSYAANYVRRVTDRYINYGLTQHGQQTIRASNNLMSTKNRVIALFSSLVDSLVFQGSEVQVDSSSRVRERASGVFPSSLADPTNGESNDFEARSVPPMPELTIEAYGGRNEEIVSGPAGRRQQIVEVDVDLGSAGLEGDGVGTGGYDSSGSPQEGGGYDKCGTPVPAGSGPGGFDENGDPLEAGGNKKKGEPVPAGSGPGGFDEDGNPLEAGGYDVNGTPVPAGSGPGGFDEDGDPLEAGGYDKTGELVPAGSGPGGFDINGDPLEAGGYDKTGELVPAGIADNGLEEIITYSLPYSPDDYYVPAGGSFASAVSSNSGANAYNYGKIQYRLELGTRKGLSLQVPVEQMPLSPFDPLYLQLDDVTGQYRANGMSWTMDSNGIVGQIDAVFWQGTGQTGTPGPIWFPTPPGVSTLPTTPNSVVNASPAPANNALLPVGWDPAAPDLTTLFGGLPTGVAPVYPTVLDAPAGLNPFIEIVPLLAITRSVLSVVSVPYSLVPQSATADMVTQAVFVGLQVVLVEVPVTSLTLATFVPEVTPSGLFPLVSLNLTSYAPAVGKLVALSSITYSQSSVWTDTTAASSSAMSDGSYNTGTQTGTNFDLNGFIQMDLGSICNVTEVIVGCDFDQVLPPGDWEIGNTENLRIMISNTGSAGSFTEIGNTGTFSTGIKTFPVSASGRYIRITSDVGVQQFICCTEFYATAYAAS